MKRGKDTDPFLSDVVPVICLLNFIHSVGAMTPA